MLPDFFSCSLFPVQQTTSGIGNRIKYFFRVGNQYAECEKQQMLGCGSFVRGRKRKKGDSIPFILPRRDYMPRLPDEVTW